LVLDFKESITGEQNSLDERLALLDTQVKEYLGNILKASQSTSQTDCMIEYLRDMLLKVGENFMPGSSIKNAQGVKYKIARALELAIK